MKKNLLAAFAAIAGLTLAGCSFGGITISESSTAESSSTQVSTAESSSTQVSSTDSSSSAAQATEVVTLNGTSNMYSVIDISYSVTLFDDYSASYTVTLGGAMCPDDYKGTTTVPTAWTIDATTGTISYTAYVTDQTTQQVSEVEVPVYLGSNGTYYSVTPAAVCGNETVVSNATITTLSGSSSMYGVIDIDNAVALSDKGDAFYTVTLGGDMCPEAYKGTTVVPTTWEIDAETNTINYTAYATDQTTQQVSEVEVPVYLGSNGTYYSVTPAAVCGNETVIASAEIVADMNGTSSMYYGYIEITDKVVLTASGDAFYTVTLGGDLCPDAYKGTSVVPTTWTKDATTGEISYTAYATDTSTGTITTATVKVTASEKGTYYAVVPAAICGNDTFIASSNIVAAMTGESAMYNGAIEVYNAVVLTENGDAFYTVTLGGEYCPEAMAGTTIVPTTWAKDATTGAITYTAYVTDMTTQEVSTVSVPVYATEKGVYFSLTPATVCGNETAISNTTIDETLTGSSAMYEGGITINVTGWFYANNDAFYAVTIGGDYAGAMAGTTVIPTSWVKSDEGSSFTVYATDTTTGAVSAITVQILSTEEGVNYAVIPAAACGNETTIANGTLSTGEEAADE